MIEHRGHRNRDADLQINISGSQYVWKAWKYSKFAINIFSFAFFRIVSWAAHSGSCIIVFQLIPYTKSYFSHTVEDGRKIWLRRRRIWLRPRHVWLRQGPLWLLASYNLISRGPHYLKIDVWAKMKIGVWKPKKGLPEFLVEAKSIFRIQIFIFWGQKYEITKIKWKKNKFKFCWESIQIANVIKKYYVCLAFSNSSLARASTKALLAST